MEDLVARGFTGVLHTFSENDYNWYRRQMERIVAVSHELGLEVQVGPWGLAHAFGGEAESLFMTQHPHLGQQFADGRRIGAGCPSQPEFRAFVKQWAQAAVDLGADRVFWDEPHWAHPVRFHPQPDSADAWTCVCEACTTAFRDRFGAEMPHELTEEVRSFREDVLTDFVRELVAHVDAIGGRSTVCLLPSVDGLHAVDSWEPVASAPGLDTLATDPYWSFFGLDVQEFVGGQARRTAELAQAHQLTPQIWIQGFKLGPDDEADIHAAVQAARDAGVEDLWTWGYEACGHMTHLDTREPERVWEILTEALTGGGRG
ncbi:hypothetical protein [Egicoccus halophilus]|uniref:Uncharacterized protein n=1 Tax=Egicoccus halophilus TaxID=1670830 RepID=A0A8J3EYR3_9ACTN|nr:hypothetical protein [Egicoccus halophilus]GGI08414.1 hypothetical protein GCM10011354_28970 [Egicoccus halophilus]